MALMRDIGDLPSRHPSFRRTPFSMRTTWGLTTIMSPLALPLTEAHIPRVVLALQMKEREIVENSTIAIYMIDRCNFS
jgi:hypothetical protein